MEHQNPTENGGVTAIRAKHSVSVSQDVGSVKIHVEMNCPTIELALSLLERAHRELEARFRFMRAQELQLEAIENARIADVADSLMRRKV